MITRIVRMEFDPEKVDAFRQIFDEVKAKIRAFEGCDHLELHRDDDEANVLYTVSYWASADDLERYRRSELFTTTWARTRELFKGRGSAYSLRLLERIG